VKKNILFIAFIFISLSLYSQSFKLWKGDTVNITDANNLKQKYWVFINKDSVNINSNGNYVDGLKQGIWKFYFEGGKIKSEITYKNNRKKGPAKVYYKNGQISEEGIWEHNKWVGKYKSYYENGQVSYDWSYNENGERSGVQKYYHKNGKVKIEGNWKGGKESGTITEYYENGEVKTEKVFANGQCDGASIKTYEQKQIKTDDANVVNNSENSVVNNSENNDTNVGVFDGNGYHTFYNRQRKIEKDGYFLNGYLQEGKHFIYDASGKLISTKIYEKGKVVKVIKSEFK